MSVFIAAIKIGTDKFRITLSDIKNKLYIFFYIASLRYESINTLLKFMKSYKGQMSYLDFLLVQV